MARAAKGRNWLPTARQPSLGYPCRAADSRLITEKTMKCSNPDCRAVLEYVLQKGLPVTATESGLSRSEAKALSCPRCGHTLAVFEGAKSPTREPRERKVNRSHTHVLGRRPYG